LRFGILKYQLMRFPTLRRSSKEIKPNAGQDQSLYFPHGTKEIRASPLYRGQLSRWVWRFFTHQLTRPGRWFLGLWVLLGMISGVTIMEIQTYIPFLYMSAFWLMTQIVVFLNKPRVRVRARHTDRVFAGETMPVEVEVTQESHLPGLDYNVLPERLPLEVDAAEPDGIPLGTLAPGETKRIRLGLRCPKRGVYRLKGYRVESDFPFGLMNAWRFCPSEASLLVYPTFRPLSRMDLPAGRRFQPGGVALASRLGDSFEYLGNREFREGDNIRDIDWRATARMGGMPILREWREEYFLRVGVVLDTYLPQTGKPRERAERQEAFEQAVSLCAAVSDYLARQEYIVDIFAAGPDLYHLTAGRSLAYLDQILEILACVEGSKKEPLQTVEPQIHENLSQITTVFCFFLSWDETRRAFVEGLRQGGAAAKVFVISDTPLAVDDRDVTVMDRAMLAAGVEEL
jgi:uncharacterized protein (DUF58 family)